MIMYFSSLLCQHVYCLSPVNTVVACLLQVRLINFQLQTILTSPEYRLKKREIVSLVVADIEIIVFSFKIILFFDWRKDFCII